MGNEICCAARDNRKNNDDSTQDDDPKKDRVYYVKQELKQETKISPNDNALQTEASQVLKSNTDRGDSKENLFIDVDSESLYGSNPSDLEGPRSKTKTPSSHKNSEQKILGYLNYNADSQLKLPPERNKAEPRFLDATPKEEQIKETNQRYFKTSKKSKTGPDQEENEPRDQLIQQGSANETPKEDQKSINHDTDRKASQKKANSEEYLIKEIKAEIQDHSKAKNHSQELGLDPSNNDVKKVDPITIDPNPAQPNPEDVLEELIEPTPVQADMAEIIEAEQDSKPAASNFEYNTAEGADRIQEEDLEIEKFSAIESESNTIPQRKSKAKEKEKKSMNSYSQKEEQEFTFEANPSESRNLHDNSDRKVKTELKHYGHGDIGMNSFNEMKIESTDQRLESNFNIAFEENSETKPNIHHEQEAKTTVPDETKTELALNQDLKNKEIIKSVELESKKTAHKETGAKTESSRKSTTQISKYSEKKSNKSISGKESKPLSSSEEQQTVQGTRHVELLKPVNSKEKKIESNTQSEAQLEAAQSDSLLRNTKNEINLETAASETKTNKDSPKNQIADNIIKNETIISPETEKNVGSEQAQTSKVQLSAESKVTQKNFASEEKKLFEKQENQLPIKDERDSKSKDSDSKINSKSRRNDQKLKTMQTGSKYTVEYVLKTANEKPEEKEDADKHAYKLVEKTKTEYNFSQTDSPSILDAKVIDADYQNETVTAGPKFSKKWLDELNDTVPESLETPKKREPIRLTQEERKSEQTHLSLGSPQDIALDSPLGSQSLPNFTPRSSRNSTKSNKSNDDEDEPRPSKKSRKFRKYPTLKK